MRREPDAIEENLFEGQGRVRIWDLLADRDAEPFTAVLACELEALGSVGLHHQEYFPEILVCIQGQGLAEVDGAPHPLDSGSVVFLPLGSSLTLRNASDSNSLRYLIVKART